MSEPSRISNASERAARIRPTERPSGVRGFQFFDGFPPTVSAYHSNASLARTYRSVSSASSRSSSSLAA